jgi:hypothetical protein
MDLRTYGVGAQILRELGVHRMKLLGSPRRMPSMTGYGLEVTGFDRAPKPCWNPPPGPQQGLPPCKAADKRPAPPLSTAAAFASASCRRASTTRSPTSWPALVPGRAVAAGRTHQGHPPRDRARRAGGAAGAEAMAESDDFDALIALGCIIRGETYHFELVANESGAGVTRVALDHKLPSPTPS